MKRVFLAIFLVLMPIALVVSVNEYSRAVNANFGEWSGVTTINGDEADQKKCSWKCHHSTFHCKKYHVKFLKPFFAVSDTLYFGLINTMKSGDNYVYFNIALLVIVCPFLICFFCLQIVFKQLAIHKSKRNHE